MSSSIDYYENLIDECNMRILKYKRQIEGLEAFNSESANGADVFTAATVQRRKQINNSLPDTVKHPMVKKLHHKIANAVDKEYENSVMDNFYGVKKEIHKAISKLLERIEDEKVQISNYRSKIAEIIEAERREAERREAERRERERRTESRKA